ncbi:LamG domain-containing protein [Candidatus Saccharibacteria bacterium]|nr:MAG: LamG domain-containing protein [Candidatus Saccharibacteria bacterium]
MAGIDTKAKVVLHMDDVGLTDSSLSPKTVTLNGSISRSSTQSKFGGYSAVLNGTTDWLSLADSEDWNFGTGDFTLEGWFYWNGSQNTGLFAQYESALNRMFCQLLSTGSLNFYAMVSNSVKAYYFTAAGAVSSGAWKHIAYVRNGSNFYIFVDGVSQSLTVSTAISTNDLGNMATTFGIGGSANLGNFFNGYIDEVRISKGEARWTSNFTPPTSAYSIDTATSNTLSMMGV